MARQNTNSQIEATEESNGECGFHALQPNRDPQSNFEVDLAKKLEEYLLKICSGEELTENQYHQGFLHSVNFAEAALLIQGSIQVYSRKVEYLYTLVVHALEFISQKRQDHQQSSSDIPDKNEINAANDEKEEDFLGLDDVPYISKICLNDDLNRSRCKKFNYLSKPPANLVVLEGDCLYTTGDSGELDSYLLSICNFYEDFLLLDPHDAVFVHDFVKSKAGGKEHNKLQGGSSLNSMRRSCFLTPSGRSGGSCIKSSTKRKQDADLNDVSGINLDFNTYCYNERTELHADPDPTDYDLHHEDNQDAGCSDIRDCSDDEDDPWKKPLNPYQHGDLKVKPSRGGKALGRRLIYSVRRASFLCELLPLAKLDGVVGLKFSETVKPRNDIYTNIEKLRQSFVFEEPKVVDNIGDIDDGNDDNAFENELPDSEKNDFDMPQCTFDMDPLFFSHEKQGDGDTTKFDEYEPSSQHDLDSNSTLEELCCSHLDTLLASIAETEMQTELMERVSTWKQRIEHTLGEEDTHPFDIHVYGDKVLDRLSISGDSEGKMSFTDIVIGQQRHNVARTFSALLQLVNNRNADLNKKSTMHESFCHTAENPFYAKLLDPDRMQVEPSKKPKSPSRKGFPLESNKRSFNPEKGITIRHSLCKKRRRESRSRSTEALLDS